MFYLLWYLIIHGDLYEIFYLHIIMRYESLTKKALIKRIKTKRKAPCRPYSRMKKQELVNHLRLLNANSFSSAKKLRFGFIINSQYFGLTPHHRRVKGSSSLFLILLGSGGLIWVLINNPYFFEFIILVIDIRWPPVFHQSSFCGIVSEI